MLLSNNSKWINFPTLKTQNWYYQRMVLLGDAAHTAHFSIGSGTKLAMEDAIALSTALEQHTDLETALNEYTLERKPVVETIQKAALESQHYFETLKRYLGLEPVPFTFQLLTRSGRITYDELKRRDIHFGDMVDRWYAEKADRVSYSSKSCPILAVPPIFGALKLRELTLHNRLVLAPLSGYAARDGLVDERYLAQLKGHAGVGLVMTEVVAVSREGRITPGCAGMYDASHAGAWKDLVECIHTHSSAKIGMRLGHAGRRGSTRTREMGMDRPLHMGSWPLLSASPLPYTPYSQVPKEMDRADMQQVIADFVRAAEMARDAHFDLLQLHMAHGYLLASFLSPLTNQRHDEYGGERDVSAERVTGIAATQAAAYVRMGRRHDSISPEALQRGRFQSRAVEDMG